MSQIRKAQPITWDYIAGFLDGDGTIVVQEKGAVRVEWCQAIDQSWVLHEIQQFLADQGITAKLYEFPKPQKRSPNGHARLSVHRVEDARLLLQKLQPKLVVKYHKAIYALEVLQTRRGYLRIA